MQHISLFTLNRLFRKYGPDLTKYFPGTGNSFFADVPFIARVYFLLNPEDVHAVLVSQSKSLEKPEMLRKILQSSFGNGLFTSSGKLWRKQRKLMQPTFHHAHISQYAGRMKKHIEAMLETWSDGATRILDEDMHHLTFSIAVDSLFSTDASATSSEVAQAMNDLNVGVAAQGDSLLLQMLPEWFPVPALQKKQHGANTLTRLVNEMMAERRELGEANSPVDLLSMLLFTRDEETGETMDDSQIRDELVTLFIAGHETTAVTLGWVWALLAQHPDVEAKLHAELDSVLKGQSPTVEHLSQLTYTNQVIKETLRLYPPAWFLMRQIIEPVEINGESFSKGQLIMLIPYATHRDERYFEQADNFMPERWEGDFEHQLPRGAYFPFGTGPRVCIGNGFAMMEAQLAVATIAQHYRIELIDKAERTGKTTTLGFAHPVRVKLHRR